MSLHSVEALLDPATDAAVRAEWRALLDAGLPSQASHPGATNAPHVTLSGASAVPPEVEARLPGAIEASEARLPLAVRLGPLLLLGSRGPVLARLVLATTPLLRLQDDVAAAMAACDEVPVTLLPGRWTPHVTLARGLQPEEVGRALAVLESVGHPAARDGELVAVRRWDPVAKRVWEVAVAGPTMGP
ncbi:2'-5' RNA ligase family protein [Intrasporangium oryzae]|uniref:2'-5' RNA ligase family protein n=1 Tax=Intrasporangium oryzae TaxID=412687 RepID=UPI0004ADC453|nr:2'-5' RNA ligase family protein [Intrasporangium oryzae]